MLRMLLVMPIGLQKFYKMTLEYVALIITDRKEIENFCHEIHGMSEIRNFVLDKDLAREIYGIVKETTVFHIQKDEFLLEIFLN